ncbi:hypothetical protein [Helicobacter sp. UBA3407]|uniref:hypothetical protein n=1 Tax=Helicobacter TaxID=209 RepID=UPI002602EFC8|nr:hypothetical protein [Helicobacter sp. UBA3407]
MNSCQSTFTSSLRGEAIYPPSLLGLARSNPNVRIPPAIHHPNKILQSLHHLV